MTPIASRSPRSTLTGRRDTGPFIGFVGLTVPRRWLPCSPCVKVAWRLARAHWRQGFATHAARAVLRIHCLYHLSREEWGTARSISAG